MPLSTSLRDCTGCTACEAACPVRCIEMKPDQFGFSHPKITEPDKCLKCGKCDAVCPVACDKTACSEKEHAFAAFTKDQTIRERSSSGGIFSELSMQIIGAGGAVYGAVYDDDFSVKHLRIDNADDLQRCCGAKYSQSRLDNTFEQVKRDLKTEKTVLFSGSPCQVAGLHAFLGSDSDHLFCIDFVCHGVPSPAAWKEYLKYRSRESPITSINMRSKETGWSRYNYSIVIKYEDGSQYASKSSSDPYLKLFVGDFINRESCENCHFKGYNRYSDVTLADFWGIWDLYPEMDDDKGTSALIVHTHKGAELLKKCKDKIVLKEVSPDEISKQNPSILFSSKAKPQRNDALKLAADGEYDKVIDLCFPQPEFAEKMRRKLGSLLQKMKRA